MLGMLPRIATSKLPKYCAKFPESRPKVRFGIRENILGQWRNFLVLLSPQLNLRLEIQFGDSRYGHQSKTRVCVHYSRYSINTQGNDAVI